MAVERPKNQESLNTIEKKLIDSKDQLKDLKDILFNKKSNEIQQLKKSFEKIPDESKNKLINSLKQSLKDNFNRSDVAKTYAVQIIGKLEKKYEGKLDGSWGQETEKAFKDVFGDKTAKDKGIGKKGKKLDIDYSKITAKEKETKDIGTDTVADTPVVTVADTPTVTVADTPAVTVADTPADTTTKIKVEVTEGLPALKKIVIDKLKEDHILGNTYKDIDKKINSLNEKNENDRNKLKKLNEFIIDIDLNTTSGANEGRKNEIKKILDSIEIKTHTSPILESNNDDKNPDIKISKESISGKIGAEKKDDKEVSYDRDKMKIEKSEGNTKFEGTTIKSNSYEIKGEKDYVSWGKEFNVSELFEGIPISNGKKEKIGAKEYLYFEFNNGGFNKNYNKRCVEITSKNNGEIKELIKGEIKKSVEEKRIFDAINKNVEGELIIPNGLNDIQMKEGVIQLENINFSTDTLDGKRYIEFDFDSKGLMDSVDGNKTYKVKIDDLKGKNDSVSIINEILKLKKADIIENIKNVKEEEEENKRKFQELMEKIK